MSLTEKQRAAVTAPSNVVIQAGAGSGKTHVLAERLIHLLEQGVLPREVCAVTFTEAAALELRTRVERYLEKKALQDDRWSAVLDALPEAQISTIHALCGRIAREHPLESDASFNMEVLDELAFERYLQTVFPEILKSLAPEDFSEMPFSLFQQALLTLLKDPLTADLAFAPLPTHSLQNLENHLAQLREALQERHWVFTAPERTERLQMLEAIHPLNPSKDKLYPVFAAVKQALHETQRSVFTAALQSALSGYHHGHGSPGVWQDHRKAVHDTIKWLKETYLHVQDASEDQWLARALIQLEKAYRSTLQHRYSLAAQDNLMGFADLEYYASRAIRHPQVKQYYQSRWKVVMIDEFQDTSPGQWLILKSLLSDRSWYTVVGDEKQSIYGFRGSDVRLIQTLAQEGGGQVVDLDTSFRTHQHLVEVVNRVFEVLLGKMDHPSAVNMRSLNAHRTDKPQLDHPSVEVHVVQGEASKDVLCAAEARLMGLRILDLLERKVHIFDRQHNQHRPVQFGDIAVLYRARTQLKKYIEVARQLGIPYTVDGGRNLLDTNEVQDQIALLHFLANPADDLHLVAVLRSPYFMLSDPEIYRLCHDRTDRVWKVLQQQRQHQQVVKLLRQVMEQRLEDSPVELLDQLQHQTGYLQVLQGLPEGPQMLHNLARFRELLRDLARQGFTDVYSVSGHLQDLQRSKTHIPEAATPTSNAVHFMTIHRSKGLEFPVVFLLDALHTTTSHNAAVLLATDLGVAMKHPDEERTDPPFYQHIQQELTTRSELEELRVKYVAFTRAADLLILSIPCGPRPSDLYYELFEALAGTDHRRYHYALHQIPHLGQARQETPLVRALKTRTPDRPRQALPETLPVTSVGIYLKCPKSFDYQYLRGMPQIVFQWNTPNPAKRLINGKSLGSLVHTAIEQGWTTKEALQEHFLGEHPLVLHEVHQLVSSLEHPEFQSLKGLTFQKEQAFTIPFAGLHFDGVVDAFTDGWVIDYKTDQYLDPEHHLPQLSLYAHQLKVEKASLVYLRHNTLHTFSPQDLQRGLGMAEKMAEGLKSGEFPARPSPFNCRFCLHKGHCPEVQG